MLLSLLPISELRGGLPYAIAHNINPITAFVFCVIANIIIIPIIFLFLDYLHGKLLKSHSYKKGFNLFLKKIRNRKEKIEKAYESYGIFALTIFVAIPLPFTGAWTGSIIAWLLNLKRWRSFFAIALGVIIAGIIVSLIVSGILTAFNFFL